MANIPQRVKDAAAEADQQLQQLAAGLVPPAPAANEIPPAPPAAPPAPAANEIPPAPPAPSATPTSAETELQRLQQQLSTEAGRRAAQDAEMAELRGRLQAMQEVIAARPAAPPTPAAPPAPVSLISDADRQDFGEDMIDFVQRVVQQHVGSKLDALTNRFAAVEQQLKHVGAQAQTAQRSAEEIAAEKYFGHLDTNVPGWRQTNDDSRFVDWLQKRDTFSRKTRHELLKSAHAEADAETVAEFFRAYWKEMGIAPATPPAPTATPAAPVQPTVDPATLVAPSPSVSPTPSVNPRGGKIWTQREIEQVYDDRMKKRISAEDFAQKEREIEQAVIEGRVQ